MKTIHAKRNAPAPRAIPQEVIPVPSSVFRVHVSRFRKGTVRALSVYRGVTFRGQPMHSTATSVPNLHVWHLVSCGADGVVRRMLGVDEAEMLRVLGVSPAVSQILRTLLRPLV